MHPQRGEGVARFVRRTIGTVRTMAPRLWASKRLQGWAGIRDVLVHDHLTLDYREFSRKIRHDLATSTRSDGGRSASSALVDLAARPRAQATRLAARAARRKQ